MKPKVNLNKSLKKVIVYFTPEDFEEVLLTGAELKSLLANMEDILFVKVLGKKNKVFYGQEKFKFS